MRKYHLFCIFLLCLCIVLMRQSYGDTYKIWGYTETKNELPIPYATVELTYYNLTRVVQTTTSDSEGYYEFYGVNVSEDDVNIMAIKEGYYTTMNGPSSQYMGEAQCYIWLEKGTKTKSLAPKYSGVGSSEYFIWERLTMEIKQNGDKITGKWKAKNTNINGEKKGKIKGKIKGTIEGNVINFEMTSKDANGCKGKYTGIGIIDNAHNGKGSVSLSFEGTVCKYDYCTDGYIGLTEISE